MLEKKKLSKKNFILLFMICLKLGLVRPIQQEIKLPLPNIYKMKR